MGSVFPKFRRDQSEGDIRSALSVYSTSEVDALIGAIDALTSDDVDTLAEINAILTDANLASVSYVDGLAANYATAAQGTLADSALQPSGITSGTITPGTGDIDFDDLGGLANASDISGGVLIHDGDGSTPGDVRVNQIDFGSPYIIRGQGGGGDLDDLTLATGTFYLFLDQSFRGLIPSGNRLVRMGRSTLRYSEVWTGKLNAAVGSTADVNLTLETIAGQTANVIEVNSPGGSGGDRFNVDASGNTQTPSIENPDDTLTLGNATHGATWEELTVATLPVASSVELGTKFNVSDGTVANPEVYSDGSDWRYTSDDTTV